SEYDPPRLPVVHLADAWVHVARGADDRPAGRLTPAPARQRGRARSFPRGGRSSASWRRRCRSGRGCCSTSPTGAARTARYFGREYAVAGIRTGPGGPARRPGTDGPGRPAVAPAAFAPTRVLLGWVRGVRVGAGGRNVARGEWGRRHGRQRDGG